MKNTILFLGLLFLLSGCTGIKVVTDYDKSVDFSQYETFEYFGWAKESDKIMNQLDKERIEKAFAAEFAARGLKYVEEDGDLIVTLFIVVEEKTQKSATTTTYGGYGYYGRYYGYGPGYGWGPGYSSTQVYEYDYKVGTLVVDVFDAEEKKLIWEGIGTKTLDENPQSRDENVHKAVAAIMAQFPVQPVESE